MRKICETILFLDEGYCFSEREVQHILNRLWRCEVFELFIIEIFLSASAVRN